MPSTSSRLIFYSEFFRVLLPKGTRRPLCELSECLLALSLPPGVRGDHAELAEMLERFGLSDRVLDPRPPAPPAPLVRSERPNRE